jgi:hypothetical protein
MKKVLLGGAVLAVLAAVVSLSQSRTAADSKAAKSGDLAIESAAKNPWTGLKLNADPDQFQFAVVSDRTGGHRANVFSKAVYQVNLLQPEFVMSVGDLIEGYTTEADRIKDQWDQFDGYVRRFEMPFFYVTGNHDLANKVLAQKWGERYGRRYYHFTYKDVLFLCLSSENPPDGSNAIDREQQEYVRKTLAANAGVRWTFVFLHRPIWTAKDLAKNGWATVEKALAGRKYTVFCGHIHHYQKFVRNGNNYYQLATTGGGSRMRGVPYGEFDQVAWVTMKKGSPVIANVMLDGILPEDLKLPETEEPGTVRKMLATHPAAGRLTLDGKPVGGATVALHKYDPEAKKWTNVCDGLTDENGQFKLTTYSRFDGAPAGEYAITVRRTDRYFGGTGADKTPLPTKYDSPGTTTLTVQVREGENVMKLDLTSE